MPSGRRGFLQTLFGGAAIGAVVAKASPIETPVAPPVVPPATVAAVYGLTATNQPWTGYPPIEVFPRGHVGVIGRPIGGGWSDKQIADWVKYRDQCKAEREAKRNTLRKAR